jgi:bifunctional UDP-N-acetylglucosamine pyrophosphorylase/glucosamine-1-phosphate N-acetyltransferase
MIDTAVILAAGRGSRLREVTATRSKAMVPVAGKPVIARVIDELVAAGISHCIVVAAPYDEELASFCKYHGFALVVQEKPLGSADALMRCRGLLVSDFLVCACDSIVLAADVRALITSHLSPTAATLSVLEVDPQVSLEARSVVAIDGDRVVDIIEKPAPHERISNITSLPLYIFSRAVFAELAELKPSSRGELEIPSALRALIRKDPHVRFVLATQRRDLTDQRDLIEINKHYLSLMSPGLQVHPSVFVPYSVQLVPPVLIEEGVSIGSCATIGPMVYLERNSSVMSGVSVRRTVVTRGASVHSDVEQVVVVAQ